MSYLGFGIQGPRGLGKPRQAFKPVFEQLFDRKSPVSSSTERQDGKSWFEQRAHLYSEEKLFADLFSKMPLITVLAALSTTITALI
ncbi:MAG: hypothetical protein KTR13_05960 [Saprospiraceae bacterium]|nr:hypothetical protein [Saprospiraceae bacterium]